MSLEDFVGIGADSGTVCTTSVLIERDRCLSMIGACGTGFSVAFSVEDIALELAIGWRLVAAAVEVVVVDPVAGGCVLVCAAMRVEVVCELLELSVP